MIEVATQNLDEVIRQLDPRQVEKAHVRATNRAVQKGRTEWSREIRRDYAIKASDINKRSRLFRLRRFGQEAGIELASPLLPLSDFNPNKTRKGITVKIRKKEKRKLVKGGFFIPNAGKNVFKRRGLNRLPIEKLFTLSVPQMADDPGVVNPTLDAIQQQYTAEFGRLINLFGDVL